MIRSNHPTTWSRVSSAWRRTRRGSVTRYRVTLWALLAPYLLGTLVLVVLPAGLSFALAFTDYDALSPPVWVGVANFRALFHDPLFFIAWRNSCAFVLLTVPLRVAGTLALALLLNQRRRGVGAYRVAVYLPTVIPPVAYALCWLWLLNPVYGPLNQVLRALELPAPAWLVHEDTALLALALMALFPIGEGLVVLLAGRQDIPDALYHAAALDGANRWQSFRHITLPLLAPWLLLLTFRDIIVSAQSTFTPALLMTGGGPYYATLFVPLLIYETAFDRFHFGLGSALMLLLFGGVLLLIVLIHYTVGGWGYDGDV